MDSPSIPFLENRMRKSDDGISPVTDLAKNLKSLSTKLTPCRRISWTSDSPGIKYSFAMDSPCAVNSPSIDEGILRDSGANIRSTNHFLKKSAAPLRKFLFGISASQDKENFEANEVLGNSRSSPCKELPRQDSQSDLSGASQESGYYESYPEKCSEASFFSRSSMPSVRSSVFTDDEIEDDDTFFPIDKYVEDDEDDVLNKSQENVKQLLTMPLTDSSNVPKQCEESENKYPNKSGSSSWVRNCLQELKNNTSEVCTFNMSSSELYDKFDGNSLKLAFKRPEPIDNLTPLQAKRRKSSPNVITTLEDPSTHGRLHRCFSETAATIMRAVQKSDQEPNLIGDCSRPFALPLISGRHQDLKTISCETLAKFLMGEYRHGVKNFSIVDCRYPYEYEGGHIVGAKNIYTREMLYATFLSSAQLPKNELDQQSIAVFHCEFSSERAPKLLRFLRSKDREMNEAVYPRLHHPEIYLLEGGYRAFYENFKDLCVPQSYKPMLHKDHSEELREFRSKSKSFGQETKGRPKLRSNLKF